MEAIDNGSIENVPAPQIALDYWKLPANATLRDVVMVVCRDEEDHRDVNHFLSDQITKGDRISKPYNENVG